MRVFMTNEGKFYKALEAKALEDMEKPCISVEGLAALTEEPVTQIEWDTAVQAHLNTPPVVPAV